MQNLSELISDLHFLVLLLKFSLSQNDGRSVQLHSCYMFSNE